jgi:hypothetical protein
VATNDRDSAQTEPTADAGPLLGAGHHPAGHGAALGVGGVPGWWTWVHRHRLRRGFDAVTPATWRGTVNVTLWFVGLVGIAVAGRLLVGGPRPVWFVVALAVMVPVGRWWDRRPGRRTTLTG